MHHDDAIRKLENFVQFKTYQQDCMVTLVPAVTYSPASTTQLSPREMPMPAFAPSRECSPMEFLSLPPPDRVPYSGHKLYLMLFAYR